MAAAVIETPEKELKGAQKAAVLLLALETDVAARMLKLLDGNVVEEISREIASMERLGEKLSTQVVEEYYHLALAQQYAKQGGLLYARMLLQKALPADDARRILSQIQHHVIQAPFSFLQKADCENLLTFIQDEHPQTIALILSHMPAAKSAELLSGLSQNKQLEVVMRMARMDQTNPEVVREVEKGLEMRVSGLVTQTFQKCGGVEAVASILNLVDRATEKSIIESLETEAADLVDPIRRLMFVFEDIILVNDRGIQSVLKEIDNDDLVLALRTASDELKEKIFGNMSERAAQMVKEDMEYMGPVRLSDVEAAQQRIVDVVRRLEDAGEIIISGRGGDREQVV
ncbi:MAG: flagellar motor switch protein FliG [Phycisphaerae bacterium]|nr:flagellar motor switch protein FliG [Phycisphaerae bacterium]